MGGWVGGERNDNANPSGVFFTLFLRSFILLRELECDVEPPVVGSRAKGDQRCARGFAVLHADDVFYCSFRTKN
jgi:hypothetical protein